jgi:hypothetical protein
MIEGDAALEGITSRAIANALESGAGSIEVQILPFAYRHLSPLVGAARPTSQGAETMDNSPTPSRLPVTSSTVAAEHRAEGISSTSA